ncbi:MAG TPA: hypothetical protein VGM93_03310 [Acidimicrobiales bacterium]
MPFPYIDGRPLPGAGTTETYASDVTFNSWTALFGRAGHCDAITDQVYVVQVQPGVNQEALNNSRNQPQTVPVTVGTHRGIYGLGVLGPAPDAPKVTWVDDAGNQVIVFGRQVDQAALLRFASQLKVADGTASVAATTGLRRLASVPVVEPGVDDHKTVRYGYVGIRAVSPAQAQLWHAVTMRAPPPGYQPMTSSAPLPRDSDAAHLVSSRPETEVGMTDGSDRVAIVFGPRPFVIQGITESEGGQTFPADGTVAAMVHTVHWLTVAQARDNANVQRQQSRRRLDPPATTMALVAQGSPNGAPGWRMLAGRPGAYWAYLMPIGEFDQNGGDAGTRPRVCFEAVRLGYDRCIPEASVLAVGINKVEWWGTAPAGTVRLERHGAHGVVLARIHRIEGSRTVVFTFPPEGSAQPFPYDTLVAKDRQGHVLAQGPIRAFVTTVD